MGRRGAALVTVALIAAAVAWRLSRDRGAPPDAGSRPSVDASTARRPDAPQGTPAPPAPAPPVPETTPAAAPEATEERWSVSGRVTFPDGTPVAGVEVTAAYRGSATTDAEGRFAIADLRGPTAAIRVPMAGLEATAKCGDTDVNFVFPLHVVRLRPVSESGEPISPATCETSSRPPQGSGDARPRQSPDGGFVLALPAGWQMGYLLQAKDVAAATGSLRFDGSPSAHEVLVPMAPAKPPGSLAIRVTDVHGAPVPTAYVSCRDTRGYGRRWDIDDVLRKFEFDENGRVAFPQVPSGSYQFFVGPSPVARGRDRSVVPVTLEVEIRPEAHSEFDVVLLPGGRITVTMPDVLGGDESPVAIRLVDAEGREVPDALQQRHPHTEVGREHDPDVPVTWVTGVPVLPGAYVVHASIHPPGSPQHRTATLPIRVEPFATTAAELRFPR